MKVCTQNSVYLFWVCIAVAIFLSSCNYQSINRTLHESINATVSYILEAENNSNDTIRQKNNAIFKDDSISEPPVDGRIVRDDKRKAIPSSLVIDLNKFDLFCNEFIRTKKDFTQQFLEHKKEKFKTKLTLDSLIYKLNNDQKFLLSDSSSRDSVVYISLHYPVMPDSVENIVEKIFTKALYNQDGIRIFNRNKNYKWYSCLENYYRNIFKFYSERSSVTNNFPNIKVYIYEDPGINGYALLGDSVLISSSLVKKVCREEIHKKKEITSIKQRTKVKSQKGRANKTDVNEMVIRIDSRQYDILLDFVLAHEVAHILKKHNLIKVQAFLVNPLIDDNYNLMKYINLMIKKKEPHFDERVFELIEKANNANLVRLNLLMKVLEHEADACAIKYLLSKYNWERIDRFLNDDLKEIIGMEVEFKNNKKTIIDRITLLKGIEKASIFLKNFLSIESEEHLKYDERVKHMQSVLKESVIK